MPGKKGSMNKSSDIEMTNRNPQPDGGTVNGRPNTTAASDAYERAHPGSKQAATNDIKRLMNTADTSLTYKRKRIHGCTKYVAGPGPSLKDKK